MSGHDSALRVLVVSNMYPGPHGPYYGIFVGRQLESFQRLPGIEPSIVAIDEPRKGILRSPIKYVRLFGSLASRVARSRPDVILYHYGLPTAVPGPALRALTGVPYVVTLHGGDLYVLPDRLPGGQALLSAILRNAAEIIVVGKQLGRDLADRLHGPLPPISVINMGVDVDRFALGPAAPVDRIAYLGRLIDGKGVDLLIDALIGLDGPTLDVIGDGPARASLEARAQPLGNRVAFLGAARPEQVPSRLAGHGVLVVPSRAEALGLVALEGMAVGAIVVAARVGGLAELVEDGKNGFLFEPDDSESLKEVIETVRALSPERCAEIRASARAQAEANSVQKKAEETLAVLRRAVEQTH